MGKTVLLIAASRDNSIELIELLLEKGTNIEHSDLKSALTYAKNFGRKDIITYLTKRLKEISDT